MVLVQYYFEFSDYFAHCIWYEGLDGRGGGGGGLKISKR